MTGDVEVNLENKAEALPKNMNLKLSDSLASKMQRSLLARFLKLWTTKSPSSSLKV